MKVPRRIKEVSEGALSTDASVWWLTLTSEGWISPKAWRTIHDDENY